MKFFGAGFLGSPITISHVPYNHYTVTATVHSIELNLGASCRKRVNDPQHLPIWKKLLKI